MSDTPPLHVVDAPEEERYEATLGDEDQIVAVLTYRLGSSWIALLHTEVWPEYEGRGIAGRLVSWVFDDARARGLKVIPRCPYILAWLPRHPEVHDLLLRPLDEDSTA
jgi:predicted GNAT family acetyltransferase